jgi:predicted N-acetyltransferase YhbS
MAVDILAEWHHAQWSYLDRDVTLAQRAAALRRRKSDGIPLTVVALAGETVLGSASLIRHDMDTRMELAPWLASVYVAPDYRRQGIGSALVRRIEHEARTLGHKTLYLFTPDMQHFYETLGWKALESTVYRGYAQVVMIRHL